MRLTADSPLVCPHVSTLHSRPERLIPPRKVAEAVALALALALPDEEVDVAGAVEACEDTVGLEVAEASDAPDEAMSIGGELTSSGDSEELDDAGLPIEVGDVELAS